MAMPDEIQLESRYSDVQTKLIKIRGNVYKVKTTGHYVRCLLGHDQETISAIDFEGGPMLSVGNEIQDNLYVNKIWHSGDNKAYLVELYEPTNKV